MAMKRAEILARGDVQMAGFRSFVKKLAESLDIKGYAENLPDGSVKIVCEGEEKKILNLESSLKETAPPCSRVEHTEISYAPYTGEFISFERKGPDILEEDENVPALLKSMVNYMKIFVDKSEVVNTRLGEIKVSVDDMHVTLKSVKEDTAQIRQDTAQIRQDTAQIRQDTAQIPRIVENTEKILEHTSYIPRIEENTSLIPTMREDTAAIRTDTREISAKLWEKYEEMSREITQMKITLSRIEAKVFG